MAISTLGYGEDPPTSSNLPIRMKAQGDKIQFRMAKRDPGYDILHFIRTESGWNISQCPRKDSEECEYCIEFFKLKAQAKKLVDSDENITKDSPEVKKLNNKADKINPTTVWFLPIVDREDGKFKVLQVTNGVRNKLVGQKELGVDLFETEWMLMNTGKAGADLYLLSPVDSSKVEKLSEKEKVELDKALNYEFE